MNKKLTYSQIFEFNLGLIEYIQAQYKNKETAWSIFYEYYQDPDMYPTEETGYKIIKGKECTADGLLSINKIYEHEGFGKHFLKTYQKYRKNPIIFFPPEKGGINQSRSYKCYFGDRIDYTLYDIKRYYDAGKNPKGCKLESAFKKEKTMEWLNSFKSFTDFTNEFNLNGSFIDGENVINIEDGKIINEYADPKVFYNSWSKKYYSNLKKRMNQWYKRNKLL